MPGSVIGIRMNNGYEGAFSRTADTIVQVRTAKEAMDFGRAVILNDDNTWSLAGTGTTAANIAGVTCREVVQANTYDPQSNAGFPANNPCDVMVRGQMVVKVQRGESGVRAGAPVYVRINPAGDDGTVVGGFEGTAATTTANSVLVDNIEWTTGIVDSNGMAEITVKTRQKG